MSEKMTWHQSRAAESRRAILDAAEKVFLRDGYKTSIDEICVEAGISRRTLYLQFGSKEALFRAVVEVTSKRALSRLFEILEEGDAPETVLTNFATYFTTLVFDRGSMLFLRLCISEVGQFPDLALKHYETGMGRVIPILAAYLETQIQAGKIPRQPSDLLAEQLLSCFMGYRQYRSLLGLSESAARNADYLPNMLKLLR